MMKTILLTYIIICCNTANAQATLNKDTINSNITVKFDKVRPSLDEFSTAELKVSKILSSNIIILYFSVPNYIERYKTALTDYCIIETEKNTVKLLNKVEAHHTTGTMNYDFTFVISEENFQALLKDNFKKITFYFAPNELYIKENLEKEKTMEKELKNHFARLSKMTPKYKVLEPDKVQYDALIAWLLNLK